MNASSWKGGITHVSSDVIPEFVSFLQCYPQLTGDIVLHGAISELYHCYYISKAEQVSYKGTGYETRETSRELILDASNQS